MSTNLSTVTPLPPHITGILLLADGTVFYGKGIGSKGKTLGEICFNTGMTGYQETLCDPSYAGQIITFTFPHIGNVGTNSQDIEAVAPVVKGLVIRNDITPPSNYRNELSLDTWLKQHNITGISDIDTRSLVRHIRHHGAQNAMILHITPSESVNIDALLAELKSYPSLKGMELANTVTCDQSYQWDQPTWSIDHGYQTLSPENGTKHYHVVAIDYGCKLNILRCLVQYHCKVTVVPATTSAADILALQPDGIFLSNGPGDPQATSSYACDILKNLIDSGIPIFGICLGHQLLALALGCKTKKMLQGHRGSNHPVYYLGEDRVEITSQNHGFVVDDSTIPDHVEVTHRSLFDGTVEGIRLKDKPVYSVQYHPESSPGPHDSQYLFETFVRYINQHKTQHVKG